MLREWDFLQHTISSILVTLHTNLNLKIWAGESRRFGGGGGAFLLIVIFLSSCLN